MLSQVRQSDNPDIALNQLAQQNPNIANAMNTVQQAGGNGPQAFLNAARAKGMNDQQIVDFLKLAKSKFAG